MGIGASEAAEIAARAGTGASDEERHVRLLSAGVQAQAARHENGHQDNCCAHCSLPRILPDIPRAAVGSIKIRGGFAAEHKMLANVAMRQELTSPNPMDLRQIL